MSAEALPALRFRKIAVDFETLHQQGRTPILYPLPKEEGGGAVAIVPDQPLKRVADIHWQRDPRNRSRIIFADLTGSLVTKAKVYLLPPDLARTIKDIIKG